MTYKVIVKESFEKEIVIDASSEKEAISIAFTMWNKDDPLLDAPSFKGVEYKVV